MNEETMAALLEENARLKADNEMLLKVVTQMKDTLNRLLDRYMTGNHAGQL